MLGVIGLARRRTRSRPSRRRAPPRPSSCSSSAAAFLALLILRAVRTFMLTRRAADLPVAVGCVWLGVALSPQLLVGPGTLALYLGHVLRDRSASCWSASRSRSTCKRGGASRPLVGDLPAAELVADRGGLPRPARPRAHGPARAQGPLDRGAHAPRRPARRPRSARSSGSRRRACAHLAVGGLLHDIGKLAGPDAILQQAGRARRRGVRRDQAPPGDGRRAARRARRLRPRRAPARPRPSRAPRRQRLSARPARPTSSTSRRASSPSPTCTTRWCRTASTAPRGRPERALALLREESAAYDQTVVAALKRVVSAPEAGWVADLGTKAPAAPRASAPRPALKPVAHVVLEGS